MKKNFSQKKNLLSLVLVVGILLTSATIAFAGPVIKNLRAQYHNIKLIIDGKNINFSKSDEPFIVDGVTYLPIRKVGESLGKEVNWDYKTKTITMNDKSSTGNSNSNSNKNSEYLTDALAPKSLNYTSIYPSGAVDEFYINNIKYNTGIDIDSSGNLEYDVDKKYSSLEFDYGIVGDHKEHNKTNELKIFVDKGDGYKEIETLYMDRNSGIRKYSIPLRNVSKIKFYNLGNNTGIGNPVLK